MIVLDTNVISELMRPQPHPQVLAWVDGLDPARVAITAMNEAEILHGIARTLYANPRLGKAPLASRFAPIGLTLPRFWPA